MNPIKALAVFALSVGLAVALSLQSELTSGVQSNSRVITCRRKGLHLRKTAALLRDGDLSALIKRQASAGPITHLGCRNQEVYFVASPDLVREITVVQAASFPDREASSTGSSGGTCPGIVASRGSEHTSMRTALGPSYFSVSAVEAQLVRTVEETQYLLEQEGQETVASFLTPQGAGKLVSFVHRLSLRVQHRCIFNSTEGLPPPSSSHASERPVSQSNTRARTSPTVQQLARLLAHVSIGWKHAVVTTLGRKQPAMEFVRSFTNRPRQIAQLSAHYCNNVLGPRKRDLLLKRFQRSYYQRNTPSEASSDPLCLRVADEHVQNRLSAESRAGNEWCDVTEALIRQMGKETENGGGRMTADVVEALAKDLVAAGADTTAAAVTMTLFELMRSPKRLDKVRFEVSDAMSGDKDNSFPARLPYTVACVKESLRLHPPAPLFWRVAAADAIVGGVNIREGAVVAMCATHLGRDPLWWGDDANEFIPERFVDGTAEHAESTSNRHSFSYLPFGGGTRACLGGRVAMAQVPAIVALIAGYAHE